ncbi:MAG: DNA recombination protein RmuC [Bacteroidota bacterium]
MIDWVSLLLGSLLGLLLGMLGVYLLLSRRLQQQQKEWLEVQGRKAALEAELQQTQAHQQAFMAQQDKWRELVNLEFEHLAHQALEKNTQMISHQHQEALHQVLQPLKERIQDFEKRVEESYQHEARERFSLRKELEQVIQLNQQMSEEARTLSKALKGDSKTQGNWGEMVLSKVLEQSGLREGVEFATQAKELSLLDPEGRRLQPDVIVHLPEQKHLIIDAKVSLTAYERFVGEEEDGAQAAHLKRHLDSIITHINQLSEKHYPGLKGLNSPDFVLMFMPIEPAFSLAIQQRPDLFAYAWERKIVLVSPTTLLASLKTVASLWKLERQNTHAQEIARQGGRLYDKFVGFVEELKKVGINLDRAQKSHQDAMNKLQSGNGNLLKRAEKLRELGVSHQKKLD